MDKKIANAIASVLNREAAIQAEVAKTGIPVYAYSRPIANDLRTHLAALAAYSRTNGGLDPVADSPNKMQRWMLQGNINGVVKSVNLTVGPRGSTVTLNGIKHIPADDFTDADWAYADKALTPAK